MVSERLYLFLGILMMRFNLAHFRTLKAYFLLAMVFIGVVPSILTGLLLIGNGRVTLTAQAERELSGLVSGFAGEFESLLSDFEKHSAAIASLPGIKSMDPKQQTRILKELHTHFDEFGQLAVVDLAGNLQVVSKEQELISIAHVDSFQRAAKGEQAWVVAPGLFSDKLLLHMHTPIRNDEGDVIGVLGTPVTLPSLAMMLDELVRDIRGNAYLLDEKGRMLVPPQEGNTPQFDYAMNLGFPKEGIPTNSGTAAYEMNNRRYIVGYAPLPEFNWTIVLERPESDVLAPVASTINLAILTQIISILLSLALAIWLAKNLTDPLRNLVGAAKALGKGDPGAPLPISRAASVEIESLVESFRNMRRSVIQREESLRRSEEDKRAIVNAIPDLLFCINRHGLICNANGRLEENGFAPAHALIGTSLTAAKQSEFPRPLIAPILLGIEKALDIEQMQICEVSICLDHKTVINEIRIVKSGEGQDKALVIIRDITKRKQADREIRRHQSAMAASIDGMAILKDGHYIYVNQAFAKLHGYDHAGELINTPWQMLYSPEEQERIEREILPLAQANGLWRGEATGCRKDGTTYSQEISLALIETGELVSVVRDLTERNQSEQALLQAQKMESIGILAGGIAHDFNNLLTGMMGQTSLALAKLPEGSTPKRHIELAITAAERAAELTQQLLAYAGKTQFDIQTRNLNTLIRENGALLEAVIPRSATLTLDLTEGLPSIKADRAQIQQVVMNLLINAVEALEEESGNVTIKTYVVESSDFFIENGTEMPNEGDYVCLEVIDNGRGMDEETLDSIFDPFFSTKPQGSGLGLSATLGIVRAHNGYLRVSSQQGHGSCFRVYFPATAQQQTRPPVISITNELLIETILVVDDEQIVRETARDVLESMELNVLMAEDGRAALDIYKQHSSRISLVLLDMQMPVMGGEETMQHLIALDPDLKIILTSGYTETEVAATLVNNRTVFFLQKPYRSTALIDKLHQTFSQPVNISRAKEPLTFVDYEQIFEERRYNIR